MSRPARPEDVDEICGALPETELGTDARATRAPKRLVREHLGTDRHG